ncbi:MAG TPA: sulfurtransferase FdhD, partial [Oceanicaulis sp.]|nr:sulfurtransferase FdhD [Oceanicaulis sp.]
GDGEARSDQAAASGQETGADDAAGSADIPGLSVIEPGDSEAFGSGEAPAA